MARSFAVLCASVLVACLLGGCGGGGGGGGGGGSGGAISFTAAAFSAGEDGTVITTITVQRVGGSGDVSVTVALTDGAAVAPADYANAPVVLTWLAGDNTNKTFAVPIVNDHDDEQDELLTMTLGSPTGGATIGSPASATLTIVDDDAAGTVQFDAATYTYGEDGTTPAAIMVTRTGGMDGVIQVTVTGIDGTASSDPQLAAEPGDYTLSFVVTFADQFAGPVLVPLTIFNDPLPEQDETFTAQLMSPTNGAVLGALSSATVTLTDDDGSMFEVQGFVINGLFGASLAKVGGRLAIGAPGHNTSGEVILNDFGGNFLFLQAEPFAQQFGVALASRGSDLLVGSSGNAYLYDSGGNNIGSFTSGLDGFGMTVAFHQGGLLIGAPDAFGGAGAVNVYDPAGLFLQTIVGKDVEGFGSALSGASSGLAAIGAPGDTGTVHMFGGPVGGPLTLGLVIDNPFPSASSPSFGAAIAQQGNLVVVGAPDEDTLGTNDGRVYLFNGGPVTTWLPPVLVPLNGRFGANVLITSNGLICVQQEGGGINGTGQVFVFDQGGAVLATFDPPAIAPNSDFGSAMVEFDGALVIGAPKYPAVLQQGSVFFFKLPTP